MSGHRRHRSSSSGRCPSPQQRYGAAEQEPRYDPKELRDAAKVLGPFVRLIEDTNNPYARIVSREVCKTFYHLFHPGMHPADVMGAVNWDVKAQRTQQLWTEFWQYVPNARIKCWKSLKETENLIQFTGGDNDRACPLPPPTIMQPSPPPPQKPSVAECCRQQTPNRPDLDGDDGDGGCDCDGDDNRQCPRAPYRPCKSRPQNRKSMAAKAAVCNFDDSRNLADEVMPDFSLELSDSADECDEHQPAGSDLPSTVDVRGDGGNPSAASASSSFTSSSPPPPPPPPCTSTALNRIRHRMTESKRELERLVNVACNKCCASADVDESLRQTAGNDGGPSQPCRSVCGNQQTSAPVAMIRADEYDYYRMSVNMTPPSPLHEVSAVDLFPDSGGHNNDGRRNGGGAAAAAADFNHCDNVGSRDVCGGGGSGSAQGRCDDDDDVDDEEDAAAAASLMANAFTNLSLAERDLQKKKEAYALLTKKYLEFAQNPMDVEPPCPNSPTAKQILQAIFDNPPHVLKPFDDCEWNDNAFKDRDFVRLLPFYELVLNQLEYVSKKQREYGFDMLDDVMSTLYHIHYDLGDPRLKNDMLIEHVKLITRNTWEAFFYETAAGEKMPDIPEMPCRNPVRPQSREPPPQLPPQPPVCPSPRRQEPQPSTSAGRSPRRRQATPEPPANCPPQRQGSELQCTPPSGRRSASAGRRRSTSPGATLPPSTPPPPLPSTLPPPPLPPRTCPRPPASVRPAPNSPRHTRPSGHGRTGPGRNPPPPPPPPPPPAQASTSAAGARASSSAQTSQGASTPAVKCNFLRRSRPSGAPRPWAPKIKPAERPKDAKVFKAKPLPKFVRDRMRNQEPNC